MADQARAPAAFARSRLPFAPRVYLSARSVDISGGMYMILNDLSSMALVGRAIPRVGVSLALAASLFGVGAGQLVHAEGPAQAGVAGDVNGTNLPYIVCGIDTRLQSGGHQSILLTSGSMPVTPAQIDPAAIGETFRIHGRNVASCGAGEAFKGVADRTANAGSLSLPAALGWLEGDRPGPTSEEMDALNCAGNSTEGCTMLVPVATGADGGHLQSVVWAVMQVTATGANSHSGLLLGDSSALQQRNP